MVGYMNHGQDREQELEDINRKQKTRNWIKRQGTGVSLGNRGIKNR
jgi:hypothetical protein